MVHLFARNAVMEQVLFWIPIKTSWTPNGIPLYGFGTMLFVVLVVTTWLAGYRAERYGLPGESPDRRKALSERVRDLVLWTVLAGVAGARIFYMIQFPEQFDRPLVQFFQFWNGGIVFYGSALGGLLAALIVHRLLLRQFNVSAWQLADILAPSIAIGLAIGRIGCFLNGCCWGHVACPDCVQVHFPMLTAPSRDMLHDLQTSAGFAMDPQAKDDRTVGAVEPESPAEASGVRVGDIIISVDGQAIGSYGSLRDALDPENRPRGKKETVLAVRRGSEEVTLPAFIPRTLGLIPTQLYESISMTLIFIILICLYPLRRYDGQVMVTLMLCYAVHRFFNESLRHDTPKYFLGLTVSQEISILIFSAGVLMGLHRRRFPLPRPQGG
jgi:phosphatidylglycerol---prolipoprotein diacylglyceryl transferase